MENTRQIYLATNRKSEGTTESLGGMRQASDASSLPSLVNITECTSEQVSKKLISVFSRNKFVTS